MDDFETPWDDDDVNAPAPSLYGDDDDDDVRTRPYQPPPKKTDSTPPVNTPSSSEMAGDGAVGGDGLDEPGWD